MVPNRPGIRIRELSKSEFEYECYIRHWPRIDLRRMPQHTINLWQERFDQEVDPLRWRYQGDVNIELNCCLPLARNFIASIERPTRNRHELSISRILHYIYRFQRIENIIGAHPEVHELKNRYSNLYELLHAQQSEQNRWRDQNQHSGPQLAPNGGMNMSSHEQLNENAQPLGGAAANTTMNSVGLSNPNVSSIINSHVTSSHVPRPMPPHNNRQFFYSTQIAQANNALFGIIPRAHSFHGIHGQNRPDPSAMTYFAERQTPIIPPNRDATQIIDYHNQPPNSTGNSRYRETSTPDGNAFPATSNLLNVENSGTQTTARQSNGNQPHENNFDIRLDTMVNQANQMNRSVHFDETNVQKTQQAIRQPIGCYAQPNVHGENRPNQNEIIQSNLPENPNEEPTVIDINSENLYHSQNENPTASQIPCITEMFGNLTTAIREAITEKNQMPYKKDSLSNQQLNILTRSCSFSGDKIDEKNQMLHEYVQSLKSFVATNEVSGKEIMKYIPGTLHGSAHRWYLTCDGTVEFDEFLQKLKNRFEKKRHKVEVMVDIANMRLQTNESIQKHIDKLMCMLRSADMNLNDETTLKLVLNTLPAEVIKNAKLSHVKNIEALIEMCQELHPESAIVKKANPFERFDTKKKVHSAQINENFYEAFSTEESGTEIEPEEQCENAFDIEQLTYAMRTFVEKQFDKNRQKTNTTQQKFQSNQKKEYGSSLNKSKAETHQRPTTVSSGSSNSMCVRCGLFGHEPRSCKNPRPGICCWTCGRPDVKSTECTTPSCVTHREKFRSEIRKNAMIANIDGELEDLLNNEQTFNTSLALKTIDTVSPFYTTPFDERPHIDVMVRGRRMRALVDSGSQMTIISENLVGNTLDWCEKVLPTKVSMTTVDRSKHSAMGMMLVDYTFQNQTHRIATMIMPIRMESLLVGADFMKQFGIKLKFQIEKDDPNHESAQVFYVESENERYKEQVEFERLCAMINAPIEIDYDSGTAIIPETDFEKPKLETVTQPHKLSKKQQKQLDETLRKFMHTPETGILNVTPKVKHIIDTGDAPPVIKRQYPMSPYMLEEATKSIKKMLDQGIIKKISNSSWRSPMLPVKKPDGSIRLCLDARALNKATIPNSYPVADANDILANLKKTKYLSSIDLSQAFFQVALDENSQLKTAFALGNQLYCYQRMTMGLRNSPATLAALIDSIFFDLRPRAFAYCDDFILGSETFTEHIELLELIAKRLRENNLTISPKKSNFCCKQVKFLGHILSESGLAIDPERIDAIVRWKQPENVKEVKSFLGSTAWVQKFISHYSDIASPLHDVIRGIKCTKRTSSKAKIEWNEAANEAFLTLKDRLKTAPVLQLCDYTKQFKIFTDASEKAGGAVLMQGEDGFEKPIFYYSVKFSAAEQNYGASERECLAVVKAIRKFDPYIYGAPIPFVVFTDNIALTWLLEMKGKRGRLLRWAMELQSYQFDIRSRRGVDNELPDGLSRYVEKACLDNIPYQKEFFVNLVEIQREGIECKWYKKIFEKTQNEKLDRYKIENDLLYHRNKYSPQSTERIWTLVVPSELREQVLKEEHDEQAHQGTWKVANRIKHMYYWPDMVESIYQYIRKCSICRCSKPSNENCRTPIGQFRDPKSVGRLLSIDFMGPLPRSKQGNRFIFVAIDCYTKYLYVKAMRNATAQAVIDFLEKEVFLHNGVPEQIISDNGKQFTSKQFEEMCNRKGIKHIHTPVYHAKSNPVESSNKNIKMGLKTALYGAKEHSLWQNDLSKIVNTLNTTPSTITKFTPYFLKHGREIIRHGKEYRLLVDVNPDRIDVEDQNELIQHEVKQNQFNKFEENTRKHNLRSKKRIFKVGDLVYVPNTQLSNKADKYAKKLGATKKQAIVSKQIGTDTYILNDLAGKELGKYQADQMYQV